MHFPLAAHRFQLGLQRLLSLEQNNSNEVLLLPYLKQWICKVRVQSVFTRIALIQPKVPISCHLWESSESGRRRWWGMMGWSLLQVGHEPSCAEPLPYRATTFSHGPDGSTLSLGSYSFSRNIWGGLSLWGSLACLNWIKKCRRLWIFLRKPYAVFWNCFLSSWGGLLHMAISTHQPARGRAASLLRASSPSHTHLHLGRQKSFH